MRNTLIRAQLFNRQIWLKLCRNTIREHQSLTYFSLGLENSPSYSWYAVEEISFFFIYDFNNPEIIGENDNRSTKKFKTIIKDPKLCSLVCLERKKYFFNFMRSL